MLLSNRKTENHPDSLSVAARELSAVAQALSAWRSQAGLSDLQRLEQLQQMLTQMHAIDERAMIARQAIRESSTRMNEPSQNSLQNYEAALRSTLQEIGSLERILDAERKRLSPRLDAGMREREVRSAYARTLTNR
jgi:hypothetical protein